MNNFFRALIAGAAARWFGGGCLGTVLVFVLVWAALGYCSNSSPKFKRSQPVVKEKPVTKAKEAKISLVRPEPYALPADEWFMRKTA
jgi:hypothetical protein